MARPSEELACKEQDVKNQLTANTFMVWMCLLFGTLWQTSPTVWYAGYAASAWVILALVFYRRGLSHKMNTKSHIALEAALCPACLKVHETDAILLDRFLKDSLSQPTVSHWAMCPEHQKLKDEGYITLIECKNEPHSFEDALRTGNIIHIRGTAWEQLFNVPPPPNGLGFIPIGVIEKLQNMVQ